MIRIRINSYQRISVAFRHGRAFTLVELLIVIGICILLLGLLLPALRAAREQANAVVCSAHLRQIGAAMLSYSHQYNDCLFPMRDYGRWKNQNNPAKMIDPHDPEAYWGVAYAKYGGVSKEAFFCPSARDVASGDTDGDFIAGNVYTCYGLNGYGGEWSGFSSNQRQTLFGNPNFCGLFMKVSSSGNDQWVGRPISYIRNPSQFFIAQDAYEQVLDGNGDTFDNWYQWAPPNFHFDENFEWLRHFNAGNILFADWHVETLNRQAQSDNRYYTGNW